MQGKQGTQRHNVYSQSSCPWSVSDPLYNFASTESTNLSAEYGVSTQQISDIRKECRRLLQDTRLEVFTRDTEDVQNHL